MGSPLDEGIPLTLLIQRLMDADLVQPKDGLALVAQVETGSQPADSEETPESGSIRRASLVALEALAQADWSDARAIQAALDRAAAIVRQRPGKHAAPAAETGNIGEARV